MLRRVSYLLVFFGLLFLTSACVTTGNLRDHLDFRKIHEPSRTRAERLALSEPVRYPFLWEVTRNGKTSHMFGSFHFGISTDKLPIRVLELFKQSKVLATEIDMDDPDVESLYDALPAHVGKNERKGNIRKNISTQAWDILSQRSAFKDDYLDSLAPSQAYFLHQLSMFINAALNFGSIDNEFFRMAKQSGKRRVPLETPKEREEILKGVDVVEFDEVFTYQDLEKAMTKEEEISFADFVRGYKSGELSKIEDLMKKRSFEDEAFIDKRNLLWQPRLEKLFEEGDAFVVFGVGHMVGSKSLMKLLGDKGFAIKRLYGPTRAM